MAFRNQGTAANYVSALRLACIRFRLSTDWWSETLSKLFESVKYMQIARVTTSEFKVNTLLDDVLVENIIARADALENPDLGDMLVLGLAFLMIMHSERFPLVHGRPEHLFSLPHGQHSAVIIDNLTKPPMIRIRWRLRKHKPEGSLLAVDVNVSCDVDQAR